MELPNLEEKNKENVTVWETHRSGYTTVGSPSQLNIEQSMIRSLGRRIALKFPKQKEIKELEKEMERLEEEIKYYKEEVKPMTKNRALIDDIKLQIESLRKRHRAIPFIDPIDLRFNNFAKYPKPTSSAVMICIMDVSASMGEREKELSKRFFLLLYLFLERKYENVDVIFIRHHTEAIECSEEEFFNSKETGGTIVSSGLVLADKILKERYNCEVGYSGHEFRLSPSVAATYLGASVIERHITLDRSMWGSDQLSSVEPQGLFKLMSGIRELEQARGDGEIKVTESEKKVRKHLRG